MLSLFLLALPLFFTVADSSNCAHVVGQEVLEDTGGVDLYVNATNSKILNLIIFYIVLLVYRSRIELSCS